MSPIRKENVLYKVLWVAIFLYSIDFSRQLAIILFCFCLFGGGCSSFHLHISFSWIYSINVCCLFECSGCDTYISGLTCRHVSAVFEYASMGGLFLLLRSQVGDIYQGSLEGRSKIHLEERLLLRRKGDAEDQRGIREQGNATCHWTYFYQLSVGLIGH